jgi:DNA-binding NtrC family response regulator
VRELENEVRRALALCDAEIEIEHLSSEGRAVGSDPSRQLDLHARTEHLTRELVQEALARANGNVTRAAALLGLSRFGLQKILKRLQLPAK